MKKLLLLFCLSAQAGFSQTNRIDSLKRELIMLQQQPDSHTKDTLRFRTMKAVMRDFVRVNLDSSVYYNTQLVRLCQEARLQDELIYAYQFMSYLYQIKGDSYQSIHFEYKALLLAEKQKQYRRVVLSLSGLAHAYISLKNYPKAIALCQQGMAVLRKHPDVNNQLFIMNVMGTVYREQDKWDDTFRITQQIYALAQSAHNDWYVTESLHTMGRFYKKRGDMPKALNYFQKALALSEKVGDIDLKGTILLSISDLYIRQEQWKQAQFYCNQAKQIATHVNNSSVVVEVEEMLYTIFKRTGETAKALKAHENFALLKDSLSKEQNTQRIESLQAQYDNVQKQNALQKQQVQLLAQQNQNHALAQTRNRLFLGIAAVLLVATLLFWNNRQLQSKNREIDHQRMLLEKVRQQLADTNKTLETRVDERTEALVTANRELTRKNEEIKAALFKGQTLERKRVALELHDNLSSLLSAVNMSIQSINPQNLSGQEQASYQQVKQLIQSAYSEVRNISHNILPAELEKEGLARTLTTLVNQLNQTSPLQFSLSISNLSGRLPVEIEFNVYSIVLELINNAIKHAKATTITISLFRTDSGIDLSVIDDGIGLGQSPQKRGVGLQNIQTRLDSLGGTFDAVRPDESGTRITIKIPIETVRVNGNGHLV